MGEHIPVLLHETIKFLNPGPGKKYIDATLGMAGHTKELLKAGASVLGIDVDSSVVSTFNILNSKFKVASGNYAEIQRIAEANDFGQVDGVLFDLGLGSHQLDESGRGFSFQNEGPLDMRYDQRQEKTAREILNLYPEKDLIRIFYEFGEEKRFGKRIAKAITRKRKEGSIETTGELFELVKHALPGKLRFRAGDTARKIFQALRIEVNDELKNLEKGLQQAVDLLKKGGGRLVVISFHSLEDRIVKRFFAVQSRDCVCPPSFPVCVCSAKATLRVLTKKPVTASPDEIQTNSRAHSAKLRAAERI